jgi:hypothetical protein
VKGTNTPPYAILELDEEEALWLTHLLAKALESADTSTREIAGMSSSDPRSRYRTLLAHAAMIDQVTSEQLGERLSGQGQKTRKKWSELLAAARERSGRDF